MGQILVFDIILLQYYSINTLLNSFYIRQRIITNFLVRPRFTNVPPRLNVVIVFVGPEKVFGDKDSVTF